MSVLVIWSRDVLSRDVSSCYLVSRCSVSRCQPLQFWRSRDVMSRVFSRLLFCNREHIGHSRSSKVVDFCTNRKGICDFLLVINSNFGPILHRFCEFFLPHSHLTPSLGVNPFEFLDDFLSRKLESLGYPSVKISWSYLASFSLSASVWRTDRRTDGRHADRSYMCSTGLAYADAL